MGACAAMCMCVDMPTCMCSIVRVCVCATVYVYVYAYVRLRNLQERIETGPAQILANAAGRELDVRAAVGAEDEVRGACPGDHRIHLPRREIVSHVADLLLDMRRAVGFQNVPDHGVPPLRIYADADAWVCADARLSVCVCMPKRLRAHPHPPMVSVSGRGVLRDLAGSVGDLAGRRLLGCRGRGGLPGDGGDGGRGPLRPHPAVDLGHLLHVDDIPIEIYRRDLAGIGLLQVLDDRVLREEVVARQAPVAVVCWKRTGSAPSSV